MGRMKFGALVMRPRRRPEFELVAPWFEAAAKEKMRIWQPPKRRDKMMGFFEELKQAAHDKYTGGSRPPRSQSHGYLLGVVTTIEALREMAVGEPMSRRIVHYEGKSWFVPGLSCISLIEIGTDGEEVYVIVVRKE